MPIESSNPIVVPATEEKVYNTWWVYSLNVDASSSTIAMVAKYKLCRLNVDGSPDFHPTEPPRELVIRDLFLEAQTDQQIAVGLGTIITILGGIGMSRGIIS